MKATNNGLKILNRKFTKMTEEIFQVIMILKQILKHSTKFLRLVSSSCTTSSWNNCFILSRTHYTAYLLEMDHCISTLFSVRSIYVREHHKLLHIDSLAGPRPPPYSRVHRKRFS